MLTFWSGTCSLQYFTDTNDLTHSLEPATVSEDAVASQQAEEDLQLYGSRPVPFHLCENWDLDDSSGQSHPPLKRSATDFEENGRLNKVFKSDPNGLELSTY